MSVLAGIDELLHGIAIPIVMGILTGVARVFLRGWQGIWHWISSTAIGVFVGLLAHWYLATQAYDPTLKAVIEIMAALFGYDIMIFIFSRKTRAMLADAARDRLVHEVLNRGKACGQLKKDIQEDE